MASASEAFAKFAALKEARTHLKVTVIVKGKTDEVIEGRIFGVDPEASQVGIVLGMHRCVDFDVEDAEFSVEPKRVTATRNDADWIVFEE